MNSVSGIAIQEDVSQYQLTDNNWIDLSVLQNMTGHDDEFTIQLIGMFLSSAPDAMDRAQQAILDNQLDDVIAIVHKYKSSLNIMGNPKLPALASEIEKACREGEPVDAIQYKLTILQELTELVMQSLKDELEVLKS